MLILKVGGFSLSLRCRVFFFKLDMFYFFLKYVFLRENLILLNGFLNFIF